MALATQIGAFGLAIVAGAAATCAAGLDGTLAVTGLGDVGMYAVLVDFIVAATLSCIVVGVHSLLRGRRPASPSGGGQHVLPCCAKPWHYAGGLCGATLVACSVLGSKLAGLVVVFGAFIASQLVVAAIIDQRCSVSGGKGKMTLWKALGLLVAVAGAAIGTIGPLVQPDPTTAGRDNVAVALGACLGLVGGVALSLQTMLNTLLAARLGSFTRTTMLSLCVGLAATIVVCVVVTFATPGGVDATIGNLTPLASPPWLWLGGVGSVIVVASGSVVPPIIGVAGFSVALIAGQLLMSLVLDGTGELGGTGSVTAWAIASTILVFVGAAIVQLPSPFTTNKSAAAVADAEGSSSPVLGPKRGFDEGGILRSLSHEPQVEPDHAIEMAPLQAEA